MDIGLPPRWRLERLCKLRATFFRAPLFSPHAHFGARVCVRRLLCPTTPINRKIASVQMSPSLDSALKDLIGQLVVVEPPVEVTVGRYCYEVQIWTNSS